MLVPISSENEVRCFDGGRWFVRRVGGAMDLRLVVGLSFTICADFQA